jgi:hypothetical protein
LRWGRQMFVRGSRGWGIVIEMHVGGVEMVCGHLIFVFVFGRRWVEGVAGFIKDVGLAQCIQTALDLVDQSDVMASGLEGERRGLRLVLSPKMCIEKQRLGPSKKATWPW